MKEVTKTPIEIFGYDYRSEYESFPLAIKQQYCKYIKGTCVKPRKSEPDIKVGICSLGATVNKNRNLRPVIICPQRFKTDVMFDTIRQKYLPEWTNVKWIQEVNIGVGGNVDYVAVELDNKGSIKDFLCVEIQAAGTTGTPYPFVQDFIRYGKFVSKPTYGINWANEFSKTMMQQAYKKGKIVESWHCKIVFVVQDMAMEYLSKACDCSKLESSNPDMPVDFCTFSLSWNENTQEWGLFHADIKSTSIEGINTMLGGAAIDEYLSEKEFIENIERKGIADGILEKTAK